MLTCCGPWKSPKPVLSNSTRILGTQPWGFDKTQILTLQVGVRPETLHLYHSDACAGQIRIVSVVLEPRSQKWAPPSPCGN